MPVGKLSKTRYPNVGRRKDGRLVVRVTARVAGKKRLRATELQSVGTTLEQARRRAEVLRDRLVDKAATLQSGQPPAKAKAPAAADETLGEYAVRWLDEKRLRLRPGTMQRYGDIVYRHILPRLRHYRVGDISRSVVESWVAAAERMRMSNKKPYAKASLEGWWRVFVQLLQDIAADYDIPDPTRRVRPPSSLKPLAREQKVLTDEQLGAFLAAVLICNPDRYPEILTLAYTGMRPGELYGLKWDCVDLDSGHITIRRAISRGELVETTKTNAPRTVPLHPLVVEALKDHRQAQMRDLHPGLKENWVFPSDKGTLRLPQSAMKLYAEAREIAHIDIRVGPQVLRRTLNTALIKAGVDRVVLRSMIGHSSEQMTARYAGIALSDKKAAILSLFPKLAKKDG